MTDQEILQKCTEKAVENGFDFSSLEKRLGKTTDFEVEDEYDVKAGGMYFSHSEIIFSHEFLKAFFGEKEQWKWEECNCKTKKVNEMMGTSKSMLSLHEDDCASFKFNKGWQYHAKELVLSKDRLQYLNIFI